MATQIMRFTCVIVAVNILEEFAQGCEQTKILSCVAGLQNEVAARRFVTSIDQLNSYCDKIALAHLCILDESQNCSKDLRATYLKVVDAEKAVTKKLCKPGTFQDEYLEEANCILSVFSMSANEPCSGSYSDLLAALSQSSASQTSASQTSLSQLTPSVRTASSRLQNMCCAYFTVYRCARAYTGRCGRLGLTESTLAQIFQGLDHNCQQFQSSCTQTRSPWTSKPIKASDKQVDSSTQSVLSVGLNHALFGLLPLQVILVNGRSFM